MTQPDIHWLVTSPVMSEIIPITDDGAGPTEDFCDICYVQAPTKRAATLKAIAHPDMSKWVSQQRGDGCSPFTGLRIEPTTCPHGKCWCDACNEDCEICNAESEQISQSLELAGAL